MCRFENDKYIHKREMNFINDGIEKGNAILHRSLFHWPPPQPHIYIKCNVDITFFNDKNRTNFGVYLSSSYYEDKFQSLFSFSH